jgi:hypothetical protein
MAYSAVKINSFATRIIARGNVAKKLCKPASLIRSRIAGRELDALSCFLYNPQNLNKPLGFIYNYLKLNSFNGLLIIICLQAVKGNDAIRIP